MIVKICGITNLEDALAAVEAGADALGFIFAPSKRRVTPECAAEIVRQLPEQVSAAGVFVDETEANILRIAEQVGLSWIQLHGQETPEMCARIGQSYKVIKAVKVDPQGNLRSEIDYPAWKLLLDTYLPGMSGGSGQTFNWEILRNFDPERVIVAGGLNPENVSDLLSHYQPFGIDVGSGVEAFPGKKDPQKLQRFFAQIR